MLHRAVFADTETTGLHRGAGIHELALFDAETKKVISYILDPNMVVSAVRGPQDELRLTSGPADVHTREQVKTWTEVLDKELAAKGVPRPANQPMGPWLKQHAPWLSARLEAGLYPHLLGQTEDVAARQAALATRGVTLLQKRSTIEAALSGMASAIKPGSTIWIANTSFESKQLGAAAAPHPGIMDKLRGKMETIPNGHDFLYPTGVEVNTAIARAHLDDDWSRVYDAYRDHPPAPDEIAVRNVLHVPKGVSSYAEKLGLRGPGRELGIGVDTQASILSRVFGDDLGAEVHRAAEDASIHEPYVLEKLEVLGDAAREAVNRTPRGLELLAQAERGEGDLAKLARYQAISSELQPLLAEKGAVQRLARGQREILERGYAVNQVGIRAIYAEKKLTPTGEEVHEPRVLPKHERFGTLGELAKASEHEYRGAPVRSLVDRFTTAGTAAEVTGLESGLLADVEARIAGSAAWGAEPDLRALGRAGRTAGLNVLSDLGHGRGMMIAGAVGAAFLLGGMAGSARERPRPTSSLLSYNYDDWVAHQPVPALVDGVPEGMRHDGPVGAQRGAQTDFGSPYQGPRTSNQTLADQEILREREKYLRSMYSGEQFGARTFFSKYLDTPQAAHFMPGVAAPAGSLPGIKNSARVIDLDPSQYTITMADADTLEARPRSMLGALGQWMGPTYSFRLEGIDAPEIGHDGRPAQPGADVAAAAAAAMVNGKHVQMVVNPMDATYGRQLGVLFVDGKNYNLDAVRSGKAAFLPFGSPKNSLVDWAGYSAAEKRAYQGNRGIWANPWERTFFEATAGGQRPTFNSLAQPDRLVQSANNMSLITTAEAAQAAGWTPGVQAAAQDLAANRGGDKWGKEQVTPYVIGQPNAPYKNYWVEQQRDLSEFMTTHGGTRQPGSIRSRNGMRRLDSSLAVDTMGTTNNVYTQRNPNAFDIYGSRGLMRRADQAAAQRQVNQQMFQSGIGHQRM